MLQRIRTGSARRLRLRRRPACARFEPLENRALLAIGAYDVPQRDLGDYSQIGVVDVGGGGTGTLMANGRYIVTAAHVVEGYRDPDTGVWSSVDVNFYSTTGQRTTVQVPGDNIHVHPSWMDRDQRSN